MNQPKLTLLSSASNPGLVFALADPNMTPERGVILPWGGGGGGGSFHP